MVTVVSDASACYLFPPDAKDPCLDVLCSFGAQCVPSLDGLTARCQCPERCDDYGDSVGSGRSIGLRWGVTFALELDFIEPRAARRLDEDWGINHSYLFVELYGSLLGSSIPMRDAFTWSAGLGLTF